MSTKSKTIKLSSPKINYYKAIGEATFLVNNRRGFMKGKIKRIKNSYNMLVIVAIFTGICWAIMDTKYFLAYLAFIAFMILLLAIKSTSIKKSGTAMVDSKGLTIKRDKEYFLDWKQISLVGLTANVMVIISKQPVKAFLLGPSQELVDEIKKYPNIKIIIDK